MFALNSKILPTCAIGTWAWGTGMNGSKMVFGNNYSEEQLAKTFETAYDKGFVLWDTAEVYGMGNSEKILGKCIKNKENAILSTKYLPDKKYNKGKLEQSLNNSLSRLGVDSVDLYWLHQPFCLEENIIEAVEQLKNGKIKSLGLSNCTFEQAKTADKLLKKHGFSLSAVQNHYSLLAMSAEQNKLISWCNKNNVLYFGYMILEQGALTGSYSSKRMFPIFSIRRMSFGKKKFKKIEPLLDYQKQLADKYSVKPSQIPIAWSIHKGIIPIIGLTKPEYALALVDGVKIQLKNDEIDQLEKLAKQSGVVCKGSWEKNRS
ncbi:MAG: aldo/keto reductase [Acutalibacteraceae bacterium]|nr:aldo/keto reductase [Acutalibacteraceae bacterium]